MRMLSLLARPVLTMILLTGVPQAGFAAETTDAGNTYLAGGELKIQNPVAADLIAAGGRISVEKKVGADAAIAGGTVDIRAPIVQDLRVAAGTVNVDTQVGADLVAAGGKVDIGREAQVAGSAWIAGGDVSLAGNIDKGAKIYASKITISGHIRGDTRLYGSQIILAPAARIDGNLSYASKTPLPEQLQSQISGTITRLDTPQRWAGERDGESALSWFHPLFLISMLICGMLLYLLFPRAVMGTEHAIGAYPVRSLLTGLALLFTVPPVAILFMATVVGLPIGFALLLLYPLTLLLGYLASAFFLGRQVARVMNHSEPLNWKKQALFLALSLFVLSLGIAVPFLGGLILMAAVVVGLGGWAVWTQLQYKSPGQMAE